MRGCAFLVLIVTGVSAAPMTDLFAGPKIFQQFRVWKEARGARKALKSFTDSKHYKGMFDREMDDRLISLFEKGKIDRSYLSKRARMMLGSKALQSQIRGETFLPKDLKVFEGSLVGNGSRDFPKGSHVWEGYRPFVSSTGEQYMSLATLYGDDHVWNLVATLNVLHKKSTAKGILVEPVGIHFAKFVNPMNPAEVSMRPRILFPVLKGKGADFSGQIQKWVDAKKLHPNAIESYQWDRGFEPDYSFMTENGPVIGVSVRGLDYSSDVDPIFGFFFYEK